MFAGADSEGRQDGQRWIAERKNTTVEAYRPEIDTSALSGEELLSCFMQMIRILRLGVKRGRMDITTEVSMMSAHSCLPHEGHPKAACQVFECVKNHSNSTAVFDSELPHVDGTKFKPTDWTNICGDVEESRPCKMLPPRGNPVKISMFVNVAHAGDSIKRRSQTGAMTFVNSAPVTWYSKRQGTLEASTFGSEFVALRVGMEMKEGV